MKKWWIFIALISLTGCANMTERERQTAWIVAGIVVGAVIISESDGDTVINEGCRAHGKNSTCGEDDYED